MQWTLFFVLLFVSVLLLVILKNRKQTNQLVEKINGGAQLLDVRTEEEFTSGTIDGARNIPLQELHKTVDELDPDQHYITFCSHGVRSVKAMRMIKKKGCRNVDNGGSMKRLSKLIN